jgi:hypothetical protein
MLQDTYATSDLDALARNSGYPRSRRWLAC